MKLEDALEIVRPAFLATDGLWRHIGYVEPDVLIKEPGDRSWCDPYVDNGPPYEKPCWACRPATARPHSPAFHHWVLGTGAPPPANLLPLRASWAYANAPETRQAPAQTPASLPLPQDPRLAKYVPLDAPAPEPRPAESAADRLLSDSRMARRNANAPSTSAYFDREVNEWFRKTKTGYHMLVTGRKDVSPPQAERTAHCRACYGAALHSQDYHFAQLRYVAGTYETVELDDDWTRITAHSDPVYGDGDGE